MLLSFQLLRPSGLDSSLFFHRQSKKYRIPPKKLQTDEKQHWQTQNRQLCCLIRPRHVIVSGARVHWRRGGMGTRITLFKPTSSVAFKPALFTATKHRLFSNPASPFLKRKIERNKSRQWSATQKSSKQRHTSFCYPAFSLIWTKRLTQSIASPLCQTTERVR